MPHQRLLEPALVAHGRLSKTPEKRDGSKFGCLALSMMLQRLLCQSVELTVLDVTLKLLVPHFCVEFMEPLSELCKVFVRQLLDLLFNYVDLTHLLRSSYKLKSITRNAGFQPILQRLRAERVERGAEGGVDARQAPGEPSFALMEVVVAQSGESRGGGIDPDFAS